MPFTQRAVQTTHAVIEAARQFSADVNFNRHRAVHLGHAIEEETVGSSSGFPFTGEHPHLIILQVPHEGKLHAAAERLRAAGLRIAEWREPDLNHELTAICAEVVYDDQRKLFKRYELLEEPTAQPLAPEAGDSCASSEDTNEYGWTRRRLRIRRLVREYSEGTSTPAEPEESPDE